MMIDPILIAGLFAFLITGCIIGIICLSKAICEFWREWSFFEKVFLIFIDTGLVFVTIFIVVVLFTGDMLL